MIKLIRKRGGRAYQYIEGTDVPKDWAIQDEDGNVFDTKEEFEASRKPAPKPKEKKATVKSKKE